MTKQTQEHATVSTVWQILLKCWDGITLQAARNFFGNTFSSSQSQGDNSPLVLGTSSDPKAGKEGKLRQQDGTEQGLQSLSHLSTLLRSRSSPKHNWWWQDKHRLVEYPRPPALHEGTWSHRNDEVPDIYRETSKEGDERCNREAYASTHLKIQLRVTKEQFKNLSWNPIEKSRLIKLMGRENGSKSTEYTKKVTNSTLNPGLSQTNPSIQMKTYF